MLLHEEMKAQHGRFFVDAIGVTYQIVRKESNDENGFERMKHASHRLDLKFLCPSCDKRGHLGFVQSRRIRQARNTKVQGFLENITERANIL